MSLKLENFGETSHSVSYFISTEKIKFKKFNRWVALFSPAASFPVASATSISDPSSFSELRDDFELWVLLISLFFNLGLGQNLITVWLVGGKIEKSKVDWWIDR